MTGETIPTGTVTFLFSDIEGSTRLAQDHAEAWPGLLKRHHAIMQRAIRTQHGYVFQIIGDAFCVAFHTATDALQAALEAQRSLQREVWDPAPITVRMGIHTGAAESADKHTPVGVNAQVGADVSGAADTAVAAETTEVINTGSGGYSGYLTLARTQGVMSSAHGGQVLLSGASAELVRNALPRGTGLRDLGEHRLKGMVTPERLWQLVADDLRVNFPPLKTLSALPNNLPVQLNSFIGRRQELAQTRELLNHTHLLTLIGPGGTGKTRLTVQLAGELLAEFPDGVWLTELAPLADPALVLQTVAATLGLRDVPGMALYDLVTDYLRSKSLLLILDNCEHLIETCAQISEHFLRNCPKLKMIASSREALGIAGETIYRVPPLSVPEADCTSLEVLGETESVQLFVERAAAVKPGFGFNEHNAQAVAQICQRLDGIPLALELAAARIGMLTPDQIATRLDDRFRLLTGGSRTALPRQQTLRSMIDWSYDLLSETERRLFCQLTVFVGDWSLEAAEAVCPAEDVLTQLTQLVQKSLVVAEERAGMAETRFHLLETIRQYGRDRLLETGSAAQVRGRHLDYYLKLAEAGEFKFSSPQRQEWVHQCELEHDNFRAALQWGVDHDVEAALRLGGALAMFWGTRGYNVEGRRWLEAALNRAADSPELSGEAGRQRRSARAKGLLGFCGMFYGLGDYRAALDASREAVHIYRQSGSRFDLGYALSYMGNMAAFQNEMVLAEQVLAEAIRIGRELGNKIILCFALGVRSHYVALPRGDIAAARADAEESKHYAQELGMAWAGAQGDIVLARIYAILGQWDEARQHALNAMAVFQDLHDPGTLITANNALANIELNAGKLAEARRYLKQSIVSSQELYLLAFVAQSLESFAYLAQAENQPQRAARLLGAAEAIQERLGTSAVAIHRLEQEYENTVAWLQAELNEAALGNFWSEGRRMPIDKAVAYAIEV